MPRTILILINGDSPKWEGYCELLWAPLVAQPGDIIKNYRTCQDRELPSVEEVAAADLVVLPGSPYSANDDKPWVQDLLKMLPQYVATGTRIIGSCFGHQAIAKSLGGAVTANPDGRFVLKVENIQCDTQALSSVGLMTPLLLQKQQQEANSDGAAGRSNTQPHSSSQTSSPPSPTAAAAGTSGTTSVGSTCSSQASSSACIIKQVQSHGECVSALPPGAQLLAKSDTAACEMFVLGDNVLSFQFHPDLTPELTLEKIYPFISAARMTGEEAQQSLDNLTHVKPDEAAINSIIRHFVQHGVKRSPQQPGQQLPTHQQCVAGNTELQEGSNNESKPSQDQACSDAHGSSASGGTDDDGGTGDAGVVSQLAGAVADLTVHARAVMSGGLKQTCVDYEQLTAMNQVAAGSCEEAGDQVEKLAGSCTAMQAQASSVQKALDSLPQLESLLTGLDKVVDRLDAQSLALAKQLGVPEGTGLLSWASSISASAMKMPLSFSTTNKPATRVSGGGSGSGNTHRRLEEEGGVELRTTSITYGQQPQQQQQHIAADMTANPVQQQRQQQEEVVEHSTGSMMYDWAVAPLKTVATYANSSVGLMSSGVTAAASYALGNTVTAAASVASTGMEAVASSVKVQLSFPGSQAPHHDDDDAQKQ